MFKALAAGISFNVYMASFQQQELRFPAFPLLPDSRQQHSPPSRPSRELMTAVAQPTPVFTKMAPKGQLRLQAPHSIQASRF